LSFEEFIVLANYMSRTGTTGCSIPFEMYMSKDNDRVNQFNEAQVCKALKSKDTCVGNCFWKGDLYCHEHADQNNCLSFSDKCKWQDRCMDIPKEEIEFK